MKHLIILLFLLVAALAFGEKSHTGPHSKVALIGGELTEAGMALGVEFLLEPDWHIYWKNPGDSGAIPRFKFRVEGGTAGEVSWPIPERVRLKELTNYGFNHRVVFPFFVQVASNAATVTVNLDFEYLICRVECIPSIGKVSATFPVKTNTGAVASLADPRHPIPDPESPYSVHVLSRDAAGVKVELRGADLKNLREVDVFPVEKRVFTNAQPTFQAEGDQYVASFAWDTNAEPDIKKTRVLLKVSDGTRIRGFELPLDLAVSGFGWREILKSIFFAFLGGMLLNLMPCVFPVLSIKILSLISESRNITVARRGGWLYSLGVCASFLLLAAILLILRASGSELGWGFQLQSPAFVLAMVTLFFLVSLNFLGVFEVGYGMMNLGGTLQRSRFLNSSFGTGVLATFVATPCTAPFMGTAIGVSLLMPWWASLAIFGSLGAGMALPFLVLSYFPKLLAFLPRPGAWMERLKEFLAFPLLASAVWLGWVLVQQTQERGFLILGLTLVGIAFGIWLTKNWKKVGIAVVIVSIALGVANVTPGVKVQTHWAPFNPDEIASSRPVFIDFTAAWCLTCQWNKKSVLETAPIQELFAKNGVKLMKADWTDQDPVITKALAGYGRNSVPLYVYIPAKGDTVILPELITKADIEKLFTTKEQK